MLLASEAFQRREISYQFQSRSSGTLEAVFPLRGKNFCQNKLRPLSRAVQLSVNETLHKVSLPWRAYHSANSFWKVIVKVSEGAEKYFREYLKAIVGNACVNIQVFSAKGWAFPRHTSRDIPLEHDEKSSLRFTQLNRFKPKTRRTRTSCIINSTGFSLESSSRMLDECYESTAETVIKGIGKTFNCAVTIPFDERTLKALFVMISSRACFELKGNFSLRCTFLQEQFKQWNQLCFTTTTAPSDEADCVGPSTANITRSWVQSIRWWEQCNWEVLSMCNFWSIQLLNFNRTFRFWWCFCTRGRLMWMPKSFTCWATSTMACRLRTMQSSEVNFPLYSWALCW